jgi:hypothetical protein
MGGDAYARLIRALAESRPASGSERPSSRGGRGLALAHPREPAEAGEAREGHRPSRGFRHGRSERRDGDRAVSAIDARGQDRIGEQARQIGAAAATTEALAEARGVFAATAAAAGQPAPASARGVDAAAATTTTEAAAVGAAIGKFRAESGATTRAVAPVPGGAGVGARAAAAVSDAAA